MLMWRRELWLIDHGASLYFHHSGLNWEEPAKRPFVQVKDHVLLPQATDLEAADAACRQVLTPALIRRIVSLLPDAWFPGEQAAEHREVYYNFLTTRIANSQVFVNEAQHARKALI